MPSLIREAYDHKIGFFDLAERGGGIVIFDPRSYLTDLVLGELSKDKN